jgi:hypothetical protein
MLFTAVGRGPSGLPSVMGRRLAVDSEMRAAGIERQSTKVYRA